jgi:hypothetical protein
LHKALVATVGLCELQNEVVEIPHLPKMVSSSVCFERWTIRDQYNRIFDYKFHTLRYNRGAISSNPEAASLGASRLATVYSSNVLIVYLYILSLDESNWKEQQDQLMVSLISIQGHEVPIH